MWNYSDSKIFKSCAVYRKHWYVIKNESLHMRRRLHTKLHKGSYKTNPTISIHLSISMKVPTNPTAPNPTSTQSLTSSMAASLAGRYQNASLPQHHIVNYYLRKRLTRSLLQSRKIISVSSLNSGVHIFPSSMSYIWLLQSIVNCNCKCEKMVTSTSISTFNQTQSFR